MKSATQVATDQQNHESWRPLMEVATREVFELMLGSQLSVPEAADASPKPPHDVTAMVGLAGQLCGMLSFCCDNKAAVLITSKMLGVEVEKVSSTEMSDALGEISNMVAGNFKNKISGLGDGCMLSPPTVITGSDYETYSLADRPRLEIRLVFENMPVIVTLQIHS
ncbi:MAG: chemotaxis protein CheX [Candidatus Sulfotelmatobacter sp.]|jgi:chemotaxis protein CheX